MSNTKHTPGKWTIGYSCESGAPQIDAKDGDNAGEEETAPIAELWGERGEANAARIVACVNACEGINPEAVPELFDVVRKLALGNADIGHAQRALAKAEGK